MKCVDDVLALMRSPRNPDFNVTDACSLQRSTQVQDLNTLHMSIVCLTLEYIFKPTSMSLISISEKSSQIVLSWSDYVSLCFVFSRSSDTYTLLSKDPDQSLSWKHLELFEADLVSFYSKTCLHFKHILNTTIDFLKPKSDSLAAGIITLLPKIFDPTWYMSPTRMDFFLGALSRRSISSALSMLQETQREDRFLSSYLEHWAYDFCGGDQNIMSLPQVIGFTAGLLKGADERLNFSVTPKGFKDIALNQPPFQSDVSAALLYHFMDQELSDKFDPKLLHFVYFVLLETLSGNTHISILLDKTSRWYQATTPRTTNWI